MVEEIVTKCGDAEWTYDMKQSINKVRAWKSHVIASVHQERRKYEVLENLKQDEAFVIMDWAMKFLSRKYR